MPRQTPRVGVPTFGPSNLPDAVRAAGGEPVTPRLPGARPTGVALAREWAADATQVSCSGSDLDALLLAAESPQKLFGMLLAAVRLDLPTVCLPPPNTPLAAAMTAMGLAPNAGDGTEVAVDLGAAGGPRPGELLENFALANGLRAGVAAGGGPEVLVHLAAVAREAGVAGFPQMIRVLAPETPATDPSWTRENGVRALLASLGDGLHDVPTVAGALKRDLPPAAGAPEDHRLVFVRARASGAEAVCVVPAGVPEAAGECRVFGSEDEASGAVGSGKVPDGSVLVVNGCGPRGGGGLLRLDALVEALLEGGARPTVLTDGVAPEAAPGVWASLFAPEAAAGGIMGRLRDGDVLRLDLENGRIRTDVRAEGLRGRKPFVPAARAEPGYAARYARSALPALEGAGFI